MTIVTVLCLLVPQFRGLEPKIPGKYCEVFQTMFLHPLSFEGLKYFGRSYFSDQLMSMRQSCTVKNYSSYQTFNIDQNHASNVSV